MSQSPRNIISVPPEPTLRRLPWYLAYVTQLREGGIEYVSSTQIAKALNVDASQIVKDLSFLNLKGKTRIGYPVKALELELQDFLGFKRRHNAVIAGVGSLGSALIADSGLNNYGLNIVAGFDVDPDVTGSDRGGIPIYDIDEMERVCRDTRAEIGIITVPASQAQLTANHLVEAGIKALWNFTPFRIVTPADVVVQNISIYAHLAVMYNRLAGMKGGGER